MKVFAVVLIALCVGWARAENEETLFPWAQEHGVRMDSLELRPLSYLEGERGVFATRDIPEGTV